MRKHNQYFAWAALALLSLLMTACSSTGAVSQPAPSTPTTVQVPTQATFSDPFAYCQSVGTIDHPDARYTGEKIPESVIQGYLKAAGLTDISEPLELLKQTTIWRCMEKQVYACNVGANLPCDMKATTDKTPTQAMADFCKENQSADFIPMVVTGRTTIYSWHCVKGAPEVLEQVDQVDAAGYLQRIWYKLQPGS